MIGELKAVYGDCTWSMRLTREPMRVENWGDLELGLWSSLEISKDQHFAVRFSDSSAEPLQILTSFYLWMHNPKSKVVDYISIDCDEAVFSLMCCEDAWYFTTELPNDSDGDSYFQIDPSVYFRLDEVLGLFNGFVQELSRLLKELYDAELDYFLIGMFGQNPGESPVNWQILQVQLPEAQRLRDLRPNQ